MAVNQSKLQGMLAKIQRHQGTQPVQLITLASRTLNPAGEWVAAYAAPVPKRATVDVIPRTRYEVLGLDTTKNYIEVFANFTIKDTRRQGAPDRIVWNGRTWSADTSDDWQGVNGWTAAIMQALDVT